MSDLLLSLYKKMYLIRVAENAIIAHYWQDEMKTPMHMSMGSEHIAAGVCEALGPDRQVLGTYRSHALYIARTGDTDKFFAEMYGRVGGTADGKGGSMHLMDKDAGLICTSAVVGSQIPVALGAAWATGKPTAVFFGDGAMNAGVFWESLNVACSMRLPVLFVCEDNGYTVNEPKSKHSRMFMQEAVTAFDCVYLAVSSSRPTDAECVYETACEAIETMRSHGPVFLHARYYRYLQHVGIDLDAPEIRPRHQLQLWTEMDPVEEMRAKAARFYSDEGIKSIEEALDKQVMDSVNRARELQHPDPFKLWEHVWA